MTKRFVEKLALAAGSASLAAVPGAAKADLITVTGQPVSASLQDTVLTLNGVFALDVQTWDIDGAFGADFSAFGFATFAFSGTYGYGTAYRVRAGAVAILPISVQTINGTTQTVVPLNGLGLVGDGYSPVPLPNSFDVGPTLAPYTIGAAISNFFAAGYLASISTVSGSTYNTYSTYSAAPGFGDGLFNIGFAFDANGTTLYGWAEIELTLGPEFRLTINEWTYDDMGNPVHVPDRAAAVPEPASTLPALALLAAGAAGVRSWRKKKAAERADA